MEQALEGLHRTDIGKESEFLPHGKQALFGTDGRSGVIVVLGIAHGSEEHCVGLLTCIESILWEGVAHHIDGMGTANGFFILYLVAELLCHGIHDGHALGHDLGAYAIAS